MSGPELAVLACGLAGEPKAKARSEASNVLHRQHPRSTSHSHILHRFNQEALTVQYDHKPSGNERRGRVYECLCVISTDADRINVPLAEIASISSKQTSRELPPF